MSKVILPTAQVQYEVVDYWNGVGAQDCEVSSLPSKIVSDALGSPLPVSLSVMMMMMTTTVCTLTFYTIIVLLFCPTSSHQFVFFPPNETVTNLAESVTLFVCFDLGLDVQSSKCLTISKYPAFQLIYSSYISTNSGYFTT